MSTLKVNTIQNTSAAHSSTPQQIEQGRAKAWVSYDSTNDSINDSFGVSSCVDGTSGRFTINFSTNFANTNYCFTFGHTTNANNDQNNQIMHYASGGNLGTPVSQKTVSAIGIINIRVGDNTGQGTIDSCAAFFGDQ